MAKNGTRERLEAGVQIGDFRIEKRLGAGGMGIVYRARQISLNRIVALKVLGSALSRSSDIIRFQREAQAAARLNHPNIATVHFVGQDDELCYMAIEYIDGPSLARIIRCLATAGDPKLNLDSVVRTIEQAEPRAPTIRFDEPTETLASGNGAEYQEFDLDKITPEAEQLAQSTAHIRRCCELVRDAAKALAHAHEKSVVHRDIKPENLLLDKDGQVHIIDFGIARFFEDATVTQTGRLVGTPMYMSPEQVTARLDVDHRTDIYSLGLALYELLTLRPAMLAPTREGVLRNIVTKALPPVSSKNPGVSQDLEGVVHMATARDPDARYQTGDEFAADLQQWLDGSPVAAKPYRYEADLTEIEATRPRSVLVLSVVVQSVALLFLMVAAGFVYVAVSMGDLSWQASLSGLPYGLLAPGMIVFGWGLLRASGWTRWLGRAVALGLTILSVGMLAALLSGSGTVDLGTTAPTPDGPWVAGGSEVQIEIQNQIEHTAEWIILSPFQFAVALGVLVILERRKTKEWFLRAKRIRAEHKKAQPGSRRSSSSGHFFK